jgi:hypothetical protein
MRHPHATHRDMRQLYAALRQVGADLAGRFARWGDITIMEVGPPAVDMESAFKDGDALPN